MFSSKKKLLAQLKANLGKIKDGSFNFNSIEQFFIFCDKKNFHQVISDRAYQDLDMNEVFRFLDRTISKIGQQFLYMVLRTVPSTKNRIEKFEKIIKILKENPEVYDKVVFELSALNSKESYFIASLFSESYMKKPKWYWVIPLLSVTTIVSVLLSFIIPQLFFLLLLLLMINFGLHYWNKLNLYRYSTSIPQLLKLNQAAKNIARLKDTKELDPQIWDSINAIDSLGPQMTLFKLEVKLQSEIGQVVEYLVELIKALFLIEPLVLFNVLKQLDLKRSHLRRVYEYIGEIDAAISIHLLRQNIPYFCLPVTVEDEKQMKAKEVYHPLIFESVANSIDLNNKSALLTGSNMSGKTTFIRTIGINTITAQTINTCFSKEFHIPILKVHTAIRISDDLLDENSYYFEEVLTVKTLLNESNKSDGNLFLLDELFKGTNTVERIASGKAVLSYLSKGKNMVYVATHDMELAELLKDSFSLFHFTEIIQNGNIEFDYILKTGNLTKTNAIRILEINDYPQEVVEEATQVANKLANDKVNGDF